MCIIRERLYDVSRKKININCYINYSITIRSLFSSIVRVSQHIVRESPSTESVKNIPPLRVLFRKRERYVGSDSVA